MEKYNIFLRRPYAGCLELVVIIDGQATVYQLGFEKTRHFADVSVDALITWPVSPRTIKDDE
jgi:hypothetical protein